MDWDEVQNVPRHINELSNYLVRTYRSAQSPPMKFFFPDSQDQIDPGFNFETEEKSEMRVRQRDDLYIHEVLGPEVIDGLLVSKAIVDGRAGAAGKYTLAQRHRLYRVGIRRFFRLEKMPPDFRTMGDCGAFSYFGEEEPPYSVDEVIDFYGECDFDLGIAPDHIVFGFAPDDNAPPEKLQEWKRRQELTISLAAQISGPVARNEKCALPPWPWRTGGVLDLTRSLSPPFRRPVTTGLRSAAWFHSRPTRSCPA